MGLCKTSNFSISTCIKDNDLEFCTRSYSSCVYRTMRIKGWNGKVCKMMTSHFRTLLMKTNTIQHFESLFCILVMAFAALIFLLIHSFFLSFFRTRMYLYICSFQIDEFKLTSLKYANSIHQARITDDLPCHRDKNVPVAKE